MTLQIKDVYWLAGLLEGEGSFSVNTHSIHIQLAMTDVDVVERAQAVIYGSGHRPIRQYVRDHNDGRVGLTPWCEIRVTGRRAAGWMMMLYPFMGQRRQARIRELLALWKTIPNRRKSKDVQSCALAGGVR